jgi:hypothetical protein
VDLYKLVFQAAMGSEHAVKDADAAREWLELELKNLGEGPAEPTVDPISADGGIVRIHLRPYITGGGDPSSLLGAFIRTSKEYQGARAELSGYLHTLQRMCEEGELPFQGDELMAFAGKMKAAGFPPSHHSEAFRAHYHPSYRVIVHAFLSETE